MTECLFCGPAGEGLDCGDAHFRVTHAPVDRARSGTLIVATRRHVLDFADLTAEEATGFGLLPLRPGPVPCRGRAHGPCAVSRPASVPTASARTRTSHSVAAACPAAATHRAARSPAAPPRASAASAPAAEASAVRKLRPPFTRPSQRSGVTACRTTRSPTSNTVPARFPSTWAASRNAKATATPPRAAGTSSDSRPDRSALGSSARLPSMRAATTLPTSAPAPPPVISNPTSRGVMCSVSRV